MIVYLHFDTVEMKRFLLLAIVFICWFYSDAQSLNNQGVGNRNAKPEIFRQLDLNQDARLERLVEMHIRKNESSGGINGFRVEIFFSSALDARKKALDTKASFMNAYPNIEVYVIYVSPDFKVRVGNFRTRNEALALMKQVQELFPKAFIVPDIIEFPGLN
jgi:hypothetical protein